MYIFSEAIEHVGHEYYEEFFASCESVLTEDGVFVLQVSSTLRPVYLNSFYNVLLNPPNFILAVRHLLTCYKEQTEY